MPLSSPSNLPSSSPPDTSPFLPPCSSQIFSGPDLEDSQARFEFFRDCAQPRTPRQPSTLIESSENELDNNLKSDNISLQEEVARLKEAVIGLQMVIMDLTEKVNLSTRLILETHRPDSE